MSTAGNQLPATPGQMAERLKRVQIECRPALELIRAFNHENVLIYADPPYVLSTRGRKQYRHEMTDDDYRELLKELCRSRAKVMLSGYDCDLYREYLGGWQRIQTAARTQSNAQRTEILWMNFEEVEQLDRKEAAAGVEEGFKGGKSERIPVSGRIERKTARMDTLKPGQRNYSPKRMVWALIWRGCWQGIR